MEEIDICRKVCSVNGISPDENRNVTIDVGAKTVNNVSPDANGNINIDILDLVHPIGSLYWSKNSTDPSILFGGTWKRIKDTFILACGDTYDEGSSGGEASHTLTINEMPSHSHSASTDAQGSHTHGAWTDAQGNHYHNAWTDSQGNHYHEFGGIDSTAGDAITASSDFNAGRWGTRTTGWAGSHSHNVGMDWAGSHSHNIGMNEAGGHYHTVTIGNKGGNASHNNMPPYVAYYCWERTA